jgi:hypothetical protein
VERPSRLPLYIGILLAAAGWAAIGLGWYQTGQQELQTGQIPFVMSGGFGGWGLLVMGMAALLLDAVRQAAWRIEQGQRELRDALTGGETGSPADGRSARRRTRSSRRARPRDGG